MAERAGVDLAQLYEVLTHATGDCVAVRTRLPARGRRPRQPGLERLGARLHDRPHGQGPRPRDRVRGRAGAVRCSRRGSCARSSARRARPATAARTSRRWPRSSGSSPARSGRPAQNARARGGSRRGPDRRPRHERDQGRAVARAAGWSRSPAHRSTPRTPEPGWAEQDPEQWWSSVVEVCDELRAVARSDVEAVRAVGFSAARETFALFDAELRALGPGILWSDRRGRGHRVDVRRRERVPVAHRRGAERRVATRRSSPGWRGSSPTASPARGGFCSRATSWSRG